MAGGDARVSSISLPSQSIPVWGVRTGWPPSSLSSGSLISAPSEVLTPRLQKRGERKAPRALGPPDSE